MTRSKDQQPVAAAQERLLDSDAACLLRGPADPAGEHTLDDALDALGTGPFQILLMLYVGLAWISDAMEMMMLSFLGPAITCQWGLSKGQESAISSVVFAGMLFGALIAGSVSDSHGRKVGFGATAMLTALFSIASALSPSFTWMLVFRGIVGFGLGGVPVAFSLFLEFVPTKRRGQMAILMECSWTVGALGVCGLAWAVLPRYGWRVMLLLSTIPLVLLLLLFPLLPESPRYYMSKGQVDKAQKVLELIARVNGKPLPTSRLVATKAPVMSAPKPKHPLRLIISGIKACLHEVQRLFSKKLQLTSTILEFSWFTNAFTYYGLVLLTTELHAEKSDGKLRCIGPDGKDPNLTSKDYRDISIATSAEAIGLVLAFAAIDVLGRKKSMAAMLSICALGLSPLAIWEISVHSSTMFLFAARAGSMAAFVILYTYTSEVYPTSIRSFGAGFSNVFGRIGGFVAPFVCVGMVGGGHKLAAELFLISLCFTAAVASMVLPIETAGKALDADDDDDDVDKDNGGHYYIEDDVEKL